MTEFLILAALMVPGGPDVDSYNTSIHLVADKSGSMSQTDPQAARYDALNTFMALLCSEGAFVTITEFDDVPVEKLSVELTPDTLDEVQKQIAQPSPASGSTNLAAAVRGAIRKLTLKSGHRHLIILTDGRVDPAQEQALVAMIEELKREGIRVYVIGLSLPASSSSPLITMCQRTDGCFCEIMPGNMSTQAQEAAIKIALRIARRNLLRFCDARSKLRVSRTIKRISFVLPLDAALITPDGRKIEGDSDTPFVRVQQFTNWKVATAQAPQAAAPYWEGNWHAVETATGKPTRTYAFLQSGYQLEAEQGASLDEYVIHILCQDADRNPPVPVALRAFCQVTGKAATAVTVQRLSAPLPERLSVSIPLPKHEDSTVVVQLVDMQLDEPVAETRVKRDAEEPDAFRFRLFTVDGHQEVLDSHHTEDLDEKDGVEVNHSTKLFAAVELCDLPDDATIQTLDGEVKITDADGKEYPYHFETTDQPQVFCTQAFVPPAQTRQIRFEAKAVLERSQADPLSGRLVTASSRRRGSFALGFHVKAGPPRLEVELAGSLPVSINEGMIVDVNAEVSASRGTEVTRRQLLAAAARELGMAVSHADSGTIGKPVGALQIVRDGPDKTLLRGKMGPLPPGSYNLLVLYRGRVISERPVDVRPGSWIRTTLRRIPRGQETPQSLLAMPSDPTVPAVLGGDRVELSVAATSAFQRRFLDVAEVKATYVDAAKPKPLALSREGKIWTSEQLLTKVSGIHKIVVTLTIRGMGRFEETVTWRAIVPEVRLAVAPQLPARVQPPPHTQIAVETTVAVEPDLPGLCDETLAGARIELVLLDGSQRVAARSTPAEVKTTAKVHTLIIDPPRTGQFKLKAVLTAGDRHWKSNEVPLAVGPKWFSFWLVGKERSTNLVGEALLGEPSGPLGRFQAGDETRFLLAVLPSMPPNYSISSAKVHLDSGDAAPADLNEDAMGHFQTAGPVLHHSAELTGQVEVHCVGPDSELVLRQPFAMDVHVPISPGMKTAIWVALIVAVLGTGLGSFAGLCYWRRPPKDLNLQIESPEGFEGKLFPIAPSGLFRWKTSVGFNPSCDVRLDAQLREYAGNGKAVTRKPLLRCYRRFLSAKLIVETPLMSNGSSKRRELAPEQGVSELQVGEDLCVGITVKKKGDQA